MLSSEYTAEYAVGVDTAYPDVADAMAYYLVAKSAVLGFALEDGDRRRLIDIMGGGDP